MSRGRCPVADRVVVFGAHHLPAAAVQLVVVEAAQQDTVSQIGEPAFVGDAFDVVGFDETGGGTSRELTCGLPAGTVA